VHRYGDPRCGEFEKSQGVGAVHGVAQVPGLWEPNGAEVHEENVDVEAFCCTPNPSVQNGVAGHPEAHRGLSLQRDAKSDDGASDGSAQRWPVATRSSRDGQPRLVRRGQVGDVASAKAPHAAAAEALLAGVGGDDDAGGQKELSARIVEVVGVVVMGEQHGIQWADLSSRDGRTCDLGRGGAPPEPVPASRWVEGRISEDAPAIELHQDGGTADVGEAHHL
jgi:hypothetical protein